MDAVLAMLEKVKIRQNCVKISASQLVSWIINRFYDQEFERKKDAIVEAHLNRREYLLEVVKKAENDLDVEQLLKDALKSTAVKTKRKKDKKGSNDSVKKEKINEGESRKGIFS